MVTAASSADVPSPCVDVCELDDDGLCMGCLRSGDEIMAWPTLDNDGKRRLLAQLERRRGRLGNEPSGE